MDERQGHLEVPHSCGDTTEKVTENWRILGKSVQGGSHFKVGMSCQDSHACELLSGESEETLFIAIADGAGSAKYGEIGARTAVTTAISTARVRRDDVATSAVTNDDLRTFLTNCFRDCRAAVEQEADVRGEALRELATTLILVVAQRGFVAAGQIGDGACVIADAQDEVRTINGPRIGEYINETVFLTSPNAFEELQFSVSRGDIRSIAAFCDGLQVLALKLPEGLPHKAFFSPLFQFVAEPTASADQLATFLSSSRIQERADDDLTLVLAHSLP
ncbi:MAG TPA: PP2C family serine/threonine-protein phosphatase [Chthoniobacterales bacterium]|jgi:hypothetical protein|nr:PP2C family serine/threonine-protein phosphatase [Chthoniobacterales bacterium]